MTISTGLLQVWNEDAGHVYFAHGSAQCARP
jgi:hypothetical protein